MEGAGAALYPGWAANLVHFGAGIFGVALLVTGDFFGLIAGNTDPLRQKERYGEEDNQHDDNENSDDPLDIHFRIVTLRRSLVIQSP